MAGFFYPYTLYSLWYKEDVCNSIHKSLEGMKNWLAPVKDDRERHEYLKTYETCQAICAAMNPNPDKMLETLKQFEVQLKARPKPWFLSLDSWLYDVQECQERAVADCISIVNALARYLP